MKYIFQKLIFAIAVSFIYAFSLSAQINITGTVNDNTGTSLPGVNVMVKGTTTGSITDANGQYRIAVPDDNATLVFSFVGFTTQEIVVSNRRVIDVTLAEDTQQIEEVVVVGYGTQRKTDITGSVATVDPDRLTERPVTTFAEALIGQMAGVQIQQTNGAPGGEGLSIKIRGTSSITQSLDPLYVVDGFPMGNDAFRLITPSDIESIQVLKDASSTAIYGSRGSNGVVIITTKRGKTGKPRVSVTAQIGVQQRERKIEMMNRDQYVEWFKDGRNQAWLDQAVIAADPDKSPHTIYDSNARRSLYNEWSTNYMIPDGKRDPLTGYTIYDFNDPASVATMPDNDWQDLLFRNALTQQYDMSVTGGSENTKYAFSGAFVNQQGIMRGTDYTRYNFRSNISSQVYKFLEVGISLGAFYGSGNQRANGKDAPIQYALNLPPIYPVHNLDDGSWGSMVRNSEILRGDVPNPIAIAENQYDFQKRYGWMGTLFAELTLMEGLKYRINVNGRIFDRNRIRYQLSTLDLDGNPAPRPAEAYDDRDEYTGWVVEQTLTWNKTFAEKHALTLLGGYTAEKANGYTVSGQSRTFATDIIPTMNAGTMYSLTSSFNSDNAMISYLARANYVYDNKYMLTATVRTDGSSRFGENNRWGTFPSASIGWRIGQEEFMKGLEFLSDMKLRASYGLVGNNNIGDFSAIGRLGTGFYPTGDELKNVVNPSSLDNPNLGWETTRQFNVGLDLALFNNRVRMSAEYYDGTSIDLLFNVPLPRITGYANQVQNSGKIQNRGVEFQVSTNNLVGEFTWSTDFNISANRNKVLELGPDGRPYYTGAANADNSFISTIGQPIFSFYGYVYEGVFMSQADLDRYPHLGIDKVGDGRYRDVDGNGIMNTNDKAIIGDNQPNFIAGLNNNFTYKNFSLNIQLTASQGAQLFSFFKRMCGIYHGDRNSLVEQVNRWRSVDEPGDGVHFRATRTPSGWQRDPSSAWVTDASYLRLRNLSLAYNFDKQITDLLHVGGLRVFVTGQNLYTWTRYPGFDPESSSEVSNNQHSIGGDYVGYPAARSVIFGVNVNF